MREITVNFYDNRFAERDSQQMVASDYVEYIFLAKAALKILYCPSFFVTKILGKEYHSPFCSIQFYLSPKS